MRPACEPAEEFVLQLLRVQPSERVSAGHEQRGGTTPSVRTDALGCKRDRRSAGASTRMYLPIESKRLANFAKTLRRRWKPWLEQLPSRVRLAIDREALPEMGGNQFMEESFADKASLMSPCSGCKEASGRMVGTLMAGPLCSMLPWSIFGSRTTLQVQLSDCIIELPQRPGSFHIGNVSAFEEHNVLHGAESAGCYKPEAQPEWQIAVMLRTDVFRATRSRSIITTPATREVFVIRETARPIADWPLQLPDLTAVLESFIQRVIHLVHQNSACCHIVAAQHSSICLSWWDGVRLFKSGGASLLIFCSPCQALSRHNG